MTALKVIGIILLVLILIGLIRVGGVVEYDEEGLRVFARVGLLRVCLFPRKEKKEKKPKAKKETKPKPGQTEKPGEEKPKKKGGGLGPVLEYVPLVCEAAGALIHRIRIDTLDLDLVWGAGDAASAAMGYGYANAAIGMLWPPIKNSFEVKKWNFQTGVDFNAKSPLIRAMAALSFRIGQLVSFAVIYGIKFLKVYWKNKPKKSTKKEAVSDGETSFD